MYACFVDFSKAFDTVWRKGLLYKLMALATSLSSSLKVCVKELNVPLSFQMVLLHSLTLMLAFVKGVMTFLIFSMITAQDVSLWLLENTN